MIRSAALGLALALLTAPVVAAAERPSVRILGVTTAGGSTLVNYALTNPAPYGLDFVRVACNLRGRGLIDQAVDIQEDLGAGETVEGQAEFNSDEVFRGRRFNCRVAAAFRNK